MEHKFEVGDRIIAMSKQIPFDKYYHERATVLRTNSLKSGEDYVVVTMDSGVEYSFYCKDIDIVKRKI